MQGCGVYRGIKTVGREPSGVGLTRSTINPIFRPENIWGNGKSYRQGEATAQTPNERCEDNNVHHQYYHVWQVEPCHRLGEVARR